MPSEIHTGGKNPLYADLLCTDPQYQKIKTRKEAQHKPDIVITIQGVKQRKTEQISLFPADDPFDSHHHKRQHGDTVQPHNIEIIADDKAA